MGVIFLSEVDVALPGHVKCAEVVVGWPKGDWLEGSRVRFVQTLALVSKLLWDLV